MDRMTIRKKLFLVFGVLIAIFVANGLYTGYSLNQINSGALRIATEHLSSVMIGAESSRTLSDYRQGEYAVLTATTLPNRFVIPRICSASAFSMGSTLLVCLFFRGEPLFRA